MTAELTHEQAKAILDLPMPRNDAKAATIRDYLKELVGSLIREGDSFSSKRPFGNSGWEWDMHAPLIKAGLVRGRLNEYGYCTDHDAEAADRLIVAAIKHL
jgi:hypothetical protein